MTLALAQANLIVDAAIQKARHLEVDICVAVCNKLGRLIALNRMDGAYETVDLAAVGRAVASAGTGLPSGEAVGVDRGCLDIATALGEGMPAICSRGGLPILGHDGQIEGGCGVAGAHSGEQDEECARAGIASFRVDEERLSGKT